MSSVQHIFVYRPVICRNFDMSFENIFLVEERFESDGYNQGYLIGKQKGIEEGKRLGQSKAMEIGTEVGFYSGFISTLTLLYTSQDSAKASRILKMIKSLSSSLERFPVTDVHHVNFFDDLKKIRAKFKQICSLSGISLETDVKKGHKILTF
ncbi:protein LTO1 homolog [Ptychodera flava]|uniref:protein LTO1 homolog n=1 Tax=Ptychodera flava TaxID=63121 RepID=UPI003969F80C